MSGANSSISTSKLVLIPAILTLVISIIRLIGELNGWSPLLFGTGAGGVQDAASPPDSAPSLFGISWLMPIFGLYFGWRLARSGNAPAQMGMPMFLAFIAVAAAAGVIFAAMQMMEDDPTMIGKYGFPAIAFISLLVFAAWPRLFYATLLYGIYARIPIVIITYMATSMEWDTHHVKLAPDMPEMEPMAAAHFLSYAQVCFWIPATIIIGGFFGCISGMLGKKS